MDQPIVVATDGSDTAAVALAKAIELASALGRPLHVVNAYKPIGGPGLPDDVLPDSLSQSVLDDAASRARLAGLQATTHSLLGDPADAILDVAEEVGADLIVVGNKGISSKRRFMLGNVPSKVVHHALCSTYVVHTTD